MFISLFLSAPSDWLSNLAGLVNSLILLVLGSFATWYWKKYDARKKKAEQAEAEAKKTTDEAKSILESRLKAMEEAVRTVHELVKQEASARVTGLMEVHKDLAQVTGVLKESAESQRLLITVAATSGHHEHRLNRHDTEFDQVNRHLDEMRRHINDIPNRLPRHANP